MTMIEAELKAELRDPAAVRAALDALASGVVEVYRDVYYDQGDDQPMRAAGRELRIRVVESPRGERRILTYKDPSTHESGSKAEHELEVSNAATMGTVLERLGYQPSIQITKHCANYRFDRDGRELLATVVEVPELAGTFLEVETLADPAEVDEALNAVRQVLAELGVDEDELTNELYTDAIRRARQ